MYEKRHKGDDYLIVSCYQYQSYPYETPPRLAENRHIVPCPDTIGTRGQPMAHDRSMRYHEYNPPYPADPQRRAGTGSYLQYPEALLQAPPTPSPIDPPPRCTLSPRKLAPGGLGNPCLAYPCSPRRTCTAASVENKWGKQNTKLSQGQFLLHARGRQNKRKRKRNYHTGTWLGSIKRRPSMQTIDRFIAC